MSSVAPPRPVALVTGASYGLGAAIAVRLAADGYDVAVTDLAGLEPGATLAAIIDAGGRAHAEVLDLRDLTQIDAAIAGTLHALGRLDLLVNNAGVPCSKPALEVEPAEYDEVQAINVRGAYFMAQRVARHWVATHPFKETGGA